MVPPGGHFLRVMPEMKQRFIFLSMQAVPLYYVMCGIDARPPCILVMVHMISESLDQENVMWS